MNHSNSTINLNNDDCKLVQQFRNRIIILLGASLFYFVYILIRIKKGYDDRKINEIIAMFLILGSQQMEGGLLLVIFALFHNNLNEPGYNPLIWYGSNFFIESFFTLLYLYLFDKFLSNKYFNFLSNFFQEHKNSVKNFKQFILNFIYFVFIIGLLSRIFSMLSLICINLLPKYINIVSFIAYTYVKTNLDCEYLSILILYINPLILDSIVFIISDKIMRIISKNNSNKILNNDLEEQLT